MCTNWITMPDGNWRPCHLCWQCRRDRVSDWTGRCIAESTTNANTLRLTLTYGGDEYGVVPERARQLYYEDVQRYLKRLRLVTKDRVRFFCTGEYGSRKGRAHWHLILFFSGALPPDVRLEERYIHQAGNRTLWPYGWSYWEEATPEKMRYAVKYLLPDDVEGYDRLRRTSTRPEVGHFYFRNQAVKAVVQQVPPRETYRFANDRDRFGRPNEYRLTRAALFRYLDNYAQAWRSLWGNERWPECDLMLAYEDERERRRRFAPGQAVSLDYDFMHRFELEQSEQRGRWLTGIVSESENASRSRMLYPVGDSDRRATRPN